MRHVSRVRPSPWGDMQVSMWLSRVAHSYSYGSYAEIWEEKPSAGTKTDGSPKAVELNLTQMNVCVRPGGVDSDQLECSTLHRWTCACVWRCGLRSAWIHLLISGISGCNISNTVCSWAPDPVQSIMSHIKRTEQIPCLHWTSGINCGPISSNQLWCNQSPKCWKSKPGVNGGCERKAEK